MTIDDILLYMGIAAGLGILAMLIPGFFRKLLSDTPEQAKSLLRG